MTDTPPPPRPDDDPGNPPPADGWGPQDEFGPQPQGRWRRVGSRLRGSKIAVGVAGLVVAAVLVLGGIAIGHEAGGGGERGGERSDRAAAGHQERRDGNTATGDDRSDGDGENGRRGQGRDNGNGTGNGQGRQGSGTGQEVLGSITAISSSSISVRTSGGTPSYPVSANTPVTRGGSAAAVTDLKVGEAVVLRIVTASAGAAPVVASIAAG